MSSTSRFQFKFFDFLSDGMSLLVQGSKTKRSNFGAIVSIIITLSFSYISWYFGIELIQKKKVIHYVSAEEDDISTKHYFSTSEFFFNIAVTDIWENVLNDYDKYLTVRASNYNYNRTAEKESIWNITKEEYKLITCIGHPTFKGSQSYFSTFNQDAMRCLEPGKKLTLGGLFNEKEVYYLRLEVTFCNNSTSTTTCISQEEQIMEFVSRPKYISINMMNSKVASSNLDDPIQLFFKTPYFTIDSSLSKSVVITYNNIRVSTDYGWFFESKEDKYGLEFSKYETDLFLKTSVNPYLIDLAVYATNTTTLHQRSYLKLQELVAQLCGIFKVMYFVGNFILSKVSSKLIDIDVINQIYEVKDDEIENASTLTSTIKPKSNNNLVNININEFNVGSYEDSPREIPISNRAFFSEEKKPSNHPKCKVGNAMSKEIVAQNISWDATKIKMMNRLKTALESGGHTRNELEIPKQLQEDHLKVLTKLEYKHKKFQMSDLDIILSFLCPCSCRSRRFSKLDSYYAKCLNEAKNYFSFEYIIKKIREVDYIKYLQYNEAQIHSFDFLKKLEMAMDNNNLNKLPSPQSSKVKRLSSFTQTFKNEIKHYDNIHKIDRIKRYYQGLHEYSDIDIKLKQILELKV